MFLLQEVKPVKSGAGLDQQLKLFWELEAFGVVDKGPLICAIDYSIS